MLEFEKYIKEASLVITHCGAGSVLQAIDAGHIPVVCPRDAKFGEHVNDHQMDLAKHIEESGSAVVVWDVKELLKGVDRAIDMARTGKRQIAQRRALVEEIGTVLEMTLAREQARRAGDQ